MATARGSACFQSKSKSDSNLLQVLFDEAEEEEEQEQKILAVVMSAVPLIFDKREQSYFKYCLDWSNHVSELNCEGTRDIGCCNEECCSSYHISDVI